jgi:hypothetical protein
MTKEVADVEMEEKRNEIKINFNIYFEESRSPKHVIYPRT